VRDHYAGTGGRFDCAHEGTLLKFSSQTPTSDFPTKATEEALESPEECMRKFQVSSKPAIFAVLQHSYRFGEFTVDADQKVLLRNGTPLPLAPKVFDTLLILVENGGRIVEKEALMNRVWPDTFVEEANLTFNIQQLRKALGDNARKPVFIETVARRGYRFVAEVSVTSEKETSDQENGYHIEKKKIGVDNGRISQPEPSGQPPKQQKFRYIFAFSIFAVLVMGGIAFYRWQHAKVAGNRTQPTTPFKSAQMTKLSSGKALRTAVSPDGKQVAYVLQDKEGQSLWLRRTAIESYVQIVRPRNVDFLSVNFSRDGDLIYYITSAPRKFEGTLYSVPVLGGPTRKLFENVPGPIGLSHDGTQIAFTICRSEAEGIIRLMVASSDGSNEHQVYAENQPIGLSIATPPAWSPDDSYIATLRTDTREVLSKFIGINLRDASVRDLSPHEWKVVDGAEWTTDGLFVSAQHQTDDNFQLWQIDPIKQTAQKLTSDPNRYDGVSLSRDDRTLATIQDVTLTQLWSIPFVDPHNFKQITSGSSNYIDVAFTPQGKLLYSTRTKGVGDLWEMDADDGNHHELTKNAGSNYSPVSSPDGRFIFFNSSRGKTYSIYRSLADGSEARKLTDDDEEEAYPSISPDGKTVVFYNNLPGACPLKKVSSEGGTPILLNDRWNGSPAISPDGNLAAVWHAEKFADEWKLALISLKTGGNPIKSFSVPSPEGRIRWTTDGRGLLFIVTVDGVSNIWRQPVAGGKPVPVTQFQNDLIFSFDVSPDGKTLVCERGTVAQDVILLSDTESGNL
jgi:Tol biopolymer transport system component/DNA-binding winged helix-turn-helix (wHTH) protein